MAAEGAFEKRDIRHHEAKRRIGIGELALQIQKVRTRNMPGFERVPSGHGEIGLAGAFGGGFEIGGAIEQAQIGLAQDLSEFRGRNQLVTPRHGRLPLFSGRC